jgi:hypothetical protein
MWEALYMGMVQKSSKITKQLQRVSSNLTLTLIYCPDVKFLFAQSRFERKCVMGIMVEKGRRNDGCNVGKQKALPASSTEREGLG